MISCDHTELVNYIADNIDTASKLDVDWLEVFVNSVVEASAYVENYNDALYNSTRGPIQERMNWAKLRDTALGGFTTAMKVAEYALEQGQKGT